MTPSVNGYHPGGLALPGDIWRSYEHKCKLEFHKPDLQGVLACLCGACSHYYPGEKPVWTLVLGASGSGKTELLAQTLLSLPLARAVDDLTPKAFLSAWSKGPKNGLLPPPGQSSLWVAADFSKLCSLGSDERKSVASTLRQVWDGAISRDTGQGPHLSWWGKVSFVALATPEVEEQWGSMRSLGERFIYLRWRSPQGTQDRLDAIRKSRRQLGRVEEIRKDLRALVISLCNPQLRSYADVDLPSDEAMLKFDLMAELVCTLRTPVVREYDRDRSILSVATPELPTRVSSAFSQIARTHQAMFDLPPIEESLALVRRLAVDCVPLARKRILDLLWARKSPLTYSEIAETTRIPQTTLARQLEELTALDVLDLNAGVEGLAWPQRVAAFSSWFAAQAATSTLLD